MNIGLQQLVANARQHRMNPAERREQRVSLIMGLRGHSSALTREHVEEVLADVEGHEDVPDSQRS
jgi:poly-beta-hydroxyalkanoate depolymerase